MGILYLVSDYFFITMQKLINHSKLMHFFVIQDRGKLLMNSIKRKHKTYPLRDCISKEFLAFFFVKNLYVTIVI
jgi:hypothetical protein